jgi:putative ABC transport system substrate-binding protein
MRRRKFITLLGGVAASWPLAAHAQQPKMVTIGYLHTGSQQVWRPFIDAFVRGLHTVGYTEGQNVQIEYRWAEGALDKLPELAADLVHRKVSVIAASGGGTNAPLAARAATSAIPIVFTVGSDPIKGGLVPSLAHPGGNVTGVSILNADTQLKRLELAREMVPDASTVFLLANLQNPNTAGNVAELERAVRVGGQEFELVRAGTPGELDMAFAHMATNAGRAVLIVAIDPFFNEQCKQIAMLAAQHAIPAVYYFRGFMWAGGLISYGGDGLAAYKLAGEMVGKILGGAKPQEMPVQQSIRFELLINLKTAKSLGLRVSDRLLALADEVVE